MTSTLLSVVVWLTGQHVTYTYAGATHAFCATVGFVDVAGPIWLTINADPRRVVRAYADELTSGCQS